MKNINILITVLGLILLSGNAFSQRTIAIKGIADQSQHVRLRWLPSNHQQFKHSIKYGYKLSRIALPADIAPEDIDSSLLARKEWIIRLFSNEQWDSLSIEKSDTSITRIGKYLTDSLPLLNESGANLENQNGNKLFHAYNRYKTDENQFSLASLVADQSFEMAKGYAFAFLDSTVIEGYDYIYSIELNEKEIFTNKYGESQWADKSNVSIKLNSSLSLNSVSGFIAEDAIESIKLVWSMNDETPYTGYHIYRSEDSLNFERITDAPFVFMGPEQSQENAEFVDSVAELNQYYFYYVVGLSPFGFEAPPSEIKKAKAMPSPLLITIDGVSARDVAGDLVINWNIRSTLDSLPFDRSNLSGYVITYAPHIDSVYTQLLSINDPFVSTLTIQNPQNGFYIISAIDHNQYFYNSIPEHFVRLDSIAPSVPQDLQYQIQSDGRVKLTWTKNQEQDLKGYKVFYSYQDDGDFLQITKSPIKDQEYLYPNIKSNPNKRLYIAISAVDMNENESLTCDPVEIIIPDYVPPGKPVIFHAIPREEGIRIKWTLSKTTDLSHHLVQRKRSDATEWSTIQTIPKDRGTDEYPMVTGELVASNFIDTARLDVITHQYRLIAYDSSGNYSISDLKSVKPLPPPISGRIRPATATIVPKNMTYTPWPGSGPSLDLEQTNIGAQHQGTVKSSVISDGRVAKIAWSYLSDHMNTLKEFRIYIKSQPPVIGATQSNFAVAPYVLIKTITPQDATRIAQANGATDYLWYKEELDIERFIQMLPTLPEGEQLNPILNTMTAESSPVSFQIIAVHGMGSMTTPVTFPLVNLK